MLFKTRARMIQKVYEVDPFLCPKCGSRMGIIAFLADYAAVDRIIDHLKLTFSAEKQPPSPVFVEISVTGAREQNGRSFKGSARTFENCLRRS